MMKIKRVEKTRIIYSLVREITDKGGPKEEITRVAFVRRNDEWVLDGSQLSYLGMAEMEEVKRILWELNK